MRIAHLAMSLPPDPNDSSPSATACPAEERRLTTLIVAWLLAAIAIVFSQSLEFRFLSWDDTQFVTPHLERFGGLTMESVGWAFTNSENGWRTPLPYLSLLLDMQLYGLDPAGFHLTNVVIHSINTVLLFFAFGQLTQRRFDSRRRSLIASGIAATLFAIHPLHVEPVVWITCRWELLCGMFWILGMLAYARYSAAPSGWRFALVVAAYVGALLSKPMALTFPLALMLLDYWPLARVRNSLLGPKWRVSVAEGMRLTIEKTPLFVVMIVATGVTWYSKAEYVSTQGILAFEWRDKLLNALQTYGTYAFQTLVPGELSFFYPHPALHSGFNWSQVAMACAGVVLISAVAVAFARKHRWLLVGWLWYLGVFVPAIGILQVDYHARADRYTYIPLIGLLMMLAWGLQHFFRQRGPRLQAMIAAAGACWIAALMVSAHHQASVWRDSRSLYEHGLAVDNTNYKAWFNLGNIAAREGDLAGAEECYRRGLEIHAADFRAVNNWGMLQYQQGDYEGALAQFGKLTEVPHDLPGRHLIVICLLQLGRHAEARSCAETLVEEFPQNPRSHAAVGRVHLEGGRFAEAERFYRQALSMKPEERDFLFRLSQVLCEDARSDEAILLLESHGISPTASRKFAAQLEAEFTRVSSPGKQTQIDHDAS